MNKICVLMLFLSSSLYASSYKDYICSGLSSTEIPKVPVALTPTTGAITSDMTASKIFTVTLTGDATISASNIANGAGETYVYEVKRDGLGAHVVGFSNDFILDNSIATIGTGTEESLIPVMSNDTTPSPYASDASTTHSSPYPAWEAFDGVGGDSRWISQNGILTGWLKIDMGSTNFAHITKYHLEVTGAATAAPKNWTFEASQDGTNWTVLDTQSNITGWLLASPRVFGITTTTIPYRYLRIDVTANNGFSYLEIGNMEIFGIKGPSTTSTDFFEFYNTGSTLILKNHWVKN